MQMKSLCFRQHGAGAVDAPKVHAPLQAALAALERHAAINDALKAKALSEGLSWDLTHGKLHAHDLRPLPAEADDEYGGRKDYDTSLSTVTNARCLASLPSAHAPSGAAGGAGGAADAGRAEDGAPAEDDPAAFSLQRAIAFTRAMAAGDEKQPGGATKGKRAKSRHKHKVRI
jgi:hypothetical protein